MLDRTRVQVDVFLSVGSNIAPEQNLRLACRELSGDYGTLTLSSVYKNEAVGFEGADFLNMVIGLSTVEEPERIFARIERLHEQAGRNRHDGPFSSRTLDLDVLLYGDLVKYQLKLPHEDIEKYSFVLGPLAEVAPELRHPVSGKAMSKLWDGFDQAVHPLQKVDIGIV